MNKPKLSEMEYILTNFILYVRGNFNSVTIYLAIHSHSALVFVCGELRGKKSYIYVKNLNT
jgi:hypothetical protein